MNTSSISSDEKIQSLTNQQDVDILLQRLTTNTENHQRYQFVATLTISENSSSIVTSSVSIVSLPSSHPFSCISGEQVAVAIYTIKYQKQPIVLQAPINKQ